MTTNYTVNPYLTVNGASEAIELYKKAFGATENHRMPAEDGKRLMHAEISVNGGIIMMSDHFPEFCTQGAVELPTFEKPGAVAIAIHYNTPADVDGIYARAIDAGCRSVQAPEDTFWNARFAVVADPFGHQWMLNAPLSEKV
jgi:PhnB protein